MLIAVTSKDGIEINQHFGHAERFLIYEVASDALQLVGEVKADAYCNWGTILPDLDPELGSNSLNQTVYFLRRVFEPNYREETSPAYLQSDVSSR